MNLLKNIEPPKIIGLGFLIVILMGAVLLSLPVSSAAGETTNFLDALFTATSATCVTGLATVVTVEHWSLFGQIVIMLLIQIGGLGFMAVVTMAFVALGRRITLRDRIIMRESYNVEDAKGVVKFIKNICKFTFGVEIIGSIILSLHFMKEFSFTKAVYYGVFHSVSAFCNAGFDLFGESSLIDYSGDYLLNITIMGLIITGGIGFTVFVDIYGALRKSLFQCFKFKSALRGMKLHSKLVICTTAILIVFGVLFFTICEYENSKTMAAMSFPQKILNGTFQSVTLRTAGFATLNQGDLSYGSKIMCILYMFIGGSPASTAGGVKTATMAVVVVAVITLIRGEDNVVVFKKNITLATIRQALAVIMTMLSMIFAAIVVLTFTERGSDFKYECLDLVYEVVSAMCTVGNTTGITPYLSRAGKVVIILCMFAGRIGPVTMAMIFTSNNKKSAINYPEGKVIVG